MCGICGWVDKEPVKRPVLESMIGELRHRGPDAQQVEVLGNVGLGHARLSIIDLSSAANQPMSNEDHTIWLVYNGEFYTFQSYRKALMEKGHVFKSHTDSEVLIHLYEEHGPEFVAQMRGMFAFGMWDGKQKQLMLARDRVGIKPLYYFHKGNTFLFASELKALLKHPAVSREMSPEAISYYFMLGYIPREHCIFQSVKKLLPGHYLLYKGGQIETHCYWKLPEKKDNGPFNDEECTEVLLSKLEESVKLRLISDVPLGVFLSGGLDSSIVAALMARHSSTPVKTFTIGFEENKYDETNYARQVAKHIASEHHEFVVRIDNADSLEKLIYYFDEPFADSSAIPTYYVSKMARDHVKVVLSGDGGDELFGGYNWYGWVLDHEKLNAMPSAMRRTIGFIASRVPFNYRGRHFLQTLALNEFDTFTERTGFFSQEDSGGILTSDIRASALDAYQDFYAKSGSSPLERLTRTDFHYYLPDDILTKVDRASMAVSLEARVPLLDHKVCEYAFSLPDNFKIRNNVKKYLLKRIAAQLLPSGFPLERKQGFSIPLKEWMKGALGEMCMEAVHSGSTDNVFRKDFIEKLFKEHVSGAHNHAQKLWAVLVFAVWKQNL